MKRLTLRFAAQAWLSGFRDPKAKNGVYRVRAQNKRKILPET